MISQVKSVKITAQNLKSIVLEGSKKVQELEKKKQFTRERLEEKRLQEEEEKALEKRTKKIQKPKRDAKPKKISKGSFFDKVLQAGGLILVGILVNAAEKIFEISMNVLNTISEIVQNIVSGFRLIYAFFTGDFNNDEYANDKERVDKMLGDAQSEIDKIAGEDTLIGGFIKTVKPLVDLVLNAFRDNLQGKKTKDGEVIGDGGDRRAGTDRSRRRGSGVRSRDSATSSDQPASSTSVDRSTDEKYDDNRIDTGFVSGTSKSIIEIGKSLGAKGFAIAEHPDFTKDTSGGRYTPGKGYVSNVHKGAGHYDHRALDVTDHRGSLSESLARYRTVLDTLYKDRKKLGIKMLIHDTWGAFYGQAHSYTKNDRFGPGDHGHPEHMHIESIHGGLGDTSGKPAHASYTKEQTGSGPEFVGAKKVIPELNKGRSGAKRTVIVQRQIVEKVVPVPVYQ